MHFISGGAYNGKANWVNNYFQLKERDEFSWVSAYKNEPLPDHLTINTQNIIVLEGLERWILSLIETGTIDDVRIHFQERINHWMDCANQSNHKLIIIGADISKGVVPIDATLRMWRDVTGFIYQDIVKQSTTFHYIWYGIAKQLK